jgi:tripartite-type tricarboxylate transporter receptor subunit TctC
MDTRRNRKLNIQRTKMKKLLATILLATVSFMAQAWTPSKPITVVVPNAPGAGNEIAFRILAKQVENKNINFVFDYKPGAFDTIAMNYFNTLPADGHYVAIPSCQSTYVTADIWYAPNVKFNAMDFAPVTNMGKSPLGFYARLSSTTDTPEKLIAEVKSGRPLNFAVGGAAHRLAVEYMVAGAKLTVDNVQTLMYKGPAQAMTDVLSGQVEFGVFPIAVGAQMVKTGKIKLIALAGEQVMPGLEKVKLMKDYIPNLNVYACWNLILPKNTPQEIQDWYHDTFIPALNSKETKELYNEQFIFISPNEQTPQGVRAAMYRLREQWQPFARKIKPE